MYYYVLLSVTQKKIHRKLLCIFCATFVQYRMLHRLITLCVKHPMFDRCLTSRNHKLTIKCIRERELGKKDVGICFL